MPWYRVALAAREALIDRMEIGGQSTPGVRRFSPELIFGNTVATKRPEASSASSAADLLATSS
jgi:hypothetical protein